MTAYDGLNNSCIFDFETLSQEQTNGVVVSMAMLNFADVRFTSDTMAYTFDELVANTVTIKFDVQDQVKSYKRKINKETLKWWMDQGDLAKEQLTPKADDKSIADLYSFFVLNKSANVKKVYSRGNTFDPIFLEYIMRQTGNPMPYQWWEVRDTRSLIEGLAWGSDLKNSFTPPGCENFIAHDPSHDVAMDVMRLQTLVQAIG
jgi:hypothetical protein